MSLLSFQHLALKSFNGFFEEGYSIKLKIIYAFTTALLLSLFIYLESWGISNKFLHTILALSGLGLVLLLPKGAGFWLGFFIGIFWFWGVSLSFIYYDLSFLIPIVIIGFGLAYGGIFYFFDLYKSPFFKAIYLFLISFIEPFGFNWFKPELTLINSYFEIDKIYFLIILLTLAFVLETKKYFALFFLLFAINVGISAKNEIDLKIDMPSYSVPQNIRWDNGVKEASITQNLKNIDQAIKTKKDLVILPETAFSMVLNYEPLVFEKLIHKSYKIAIITGGLFYDGKNMYNSTYFFSGGKYEIAHKVVLVPFGEAVPFPKLIQDFINGIFFDGAEDYKTATKPTDFEVGKFHLRNAICYEATTDIIYKDAPKYIVATSNIAWFTPSTLPTLQNLLLKYYAQKYNAFIYHSVNMGQNKIFVP